MKPEQLDNLKALAKSATPGPWIVSGTNYSATMIETLAAMPKADHAYGDQAVVASSEWTHCLDADAAYIAAANPAIVLAMIAHIRELEALAAQRDAEYHAANDDRANYAMRIRELEAKFAASDAEVTRLAVVVQPVETIDSRDFRDTLDSYVGAANEGGSYALEERAAIIAYIDARLAAGTTGKQDVQKDKSLTQHFSPFYLLSNARRIASRDMALAQNWALASSLFAVGSTTARRICIEAGIDPDDLYVRKIPASDAAMSAAEGERKP